MADAAVAEVLLPDRGDPALQRQENRSRGGMQPRFIDVEEHDEPPPAHEERHIYSRADRHNLRIERMHLPMWTPTHQTADRSHCRHLRHALAHPQSPPIAATGAPPTDADDGMPPASSDDGMPPAQGAEAAAAAASAFSSESAVAARDEPALVACDAPMVYDVAYFRRQRGLLTRPYKQHDQTMRWLRDRLEESQIHVLHFPPPGTVSATVPAITRPEGTQYSWDQTRLSHWHWADMVAQLDDASMERLVLGEDRRSRGLITCILFENDPLDPARRHATWVDAGRTESHYLMNDRTEIYRGTPGVSASYPWVREWSFILVRDDGSYGSMIPKWSSTKAAYSFGPRYSWRPSKENTLLPHSLCVKQRHDAKPLMFDARLKWEHVWDRND